MKPSDPELNRLFLALGDPTRRAIVARLARGAATVSELAAGHGMSMPAFLGHLDKLEAAGLVESEKRGRVRHCRLVAGALVPALGWIEDQRQVWEGRLDRFDAYVTALHQQRERDEP